MDDVLKGIKQAESEIEKAMWECVRDEDLQKELSAYEEIRKNLESLTDLNVEQSRERDRVLSFCLMRIDNTRFGLGETDGSVDRMREALKVAERSGSELQIARCRLSLGARLQNQGQISKGDQMWSEILDSHLNRKDKDLQQVVGWTLISRAYLLKAKSLPEQAITVAQDAEIRLKRIDNFAGLAAVYGIMSQVYVDLGQDGNADLYRELAVEYREKAKEKEQ
ncbi:MAG: hypothetical protein ACXAEB_08500 [Candidatus Thorarchaeota archaeon]|jgi:tetratricopeptide (TPR) repeat protein